MSPSGGAMTLVDQPITWSPLNRMLGSASAKHRWFEVWPGRVHRLEPPFAAGDLISVLDDDVGHEIPVAAFLVPASPRLPPACGPNP